MTLSPSMKQNKALLCFLTVVILLSAAVDLWIAKGGPDLLYLVLMWVPAAAALAGAVLSLKSRGEKVSCRGILRMCGFRRCRRRYVFMGCLIPLIYLLVPYLLYWLLFPGTFHTYATNPVGMVLSILIAMVTGNALSLISALGEEIGWRGFLVPESVKSAGLKKALLFSGLFWCLWHFPLILLDDYMAGTPAWYTLVAFVLCIFPVSVIAALLSIESGSVWPAALLHAAHNNYDQAIFGVMTEGSDKMFFVSETGVFTIVCAWCIAILMYCRYRRKTRCEEAPNGSPAAEGPAD